MATSETITFNGEQVTARVLKVGEIREIMANLEDEDSLIWDLVDRDVPPSAVLRSTGLDVEKLTEADPEELPRLWEAVEKVNPSFAALVKKRMGEMVKALLKSTDSPA